MEEKKKSKTKIDIDEINVREKDKYGKIEVSDREMRYLEKLYLPEKSETMTIEEMENWSKKFDELISKYRIKLTKREKIQMERKKIRRKHEAEYKDIVVLKRDIIKFIKNNSLEILQNIVSCILTDDEFLEKKFAYLASQKLETISFFRYESKNSYFYEKLNYEEYEKYLFGKYGKKKSEFLKLSNALNGKNLNKCFDIFVSAKNIILNYFIEPYGDYAFLEEYMYGILYAKKYAPLEPPNKLGNRANYKDYNHSKYFEYLEENILNKYIR